MRIIFFGTPDFAVPSLKALVQSGEDVIAAVTQPDRVKGRGHKLSQPPVKEYALSQGIRVLQPAGIKSDEFIKQLSAMKPDMIVVVAYGRIIPPNMLSLPPMGCINVHASLLPKYRGAAPIQWAICRGERKTGVTTMLMDEGLDTGDMLLWEETAITDDDSADALGARLSEMGAGLLIRTIQELKTGSVKPVPQTGGSSYAPIIKKEDGKINWSLSAREIFNLVRGMYPWPGAYADIKGERITVIRAGAVDGKPGTATGCVAGMRGDELIVATGQGQLAIKQLKPEGRKAMTGWAFANGRRLKEGDCFER